MARIKLTIPSWVDQITGEIYEGSSEECTLVDVLMANVPPSKDLINLYYGEKAPLSAFRATMFDRMILQRDDGSYVVMPNSKSNESFWKRVSDS